MKTFTLALFFSSTLPGSFQVTGESFRLEAHAIGTRGIDNTLVIQQKVEDCNFLSQKTISYEGIEITTAPGGAISLFGKAKNGSSWKASYGATPGAGCQIWKVDLGRNGSFDLAIVIFGANSSGGWDTTLSLLLFDRQGLPFPWQATSKFDVSALGITQLVKLGEAHTPAVVVPVRVPEENGRMAYHAYSFSGDGTSELSGRIGDLTWPVNVSRSIAGNLPSTSLSTYRPLSVGKSQNATGSFVSLQGSNDSERRLQFTGGEVAVPELLVIDTSTARSISSFPEKTVLEKLKPGATLRGAFGQDCSDHPCAPVVLWVSQ